jgi:hypothetical protein
MFRSSLVTQIILGNIKLSVWLISISKHSSSRYLWITWLRQFQNYDFSKYVKSEFTTLIFCCLEIYVPYHVQRAKLGIRYLRFFQFPEATSLWHSFGRHSILIYCSSALNRILVAIVNAWNMYLLILVEMMSILRLLHRYNSLSFKNICYAICKHRWFLKW